MANDNQLPARKIAIYGSMILCILASSTITAATVGDRRISAFLAILGGSALALGGIWVYQISERRGEYDER